MNKWLMVHNLAVVVCMAIVTTEGIRLESWKWWVIMACMMVSYISGSFS